jgi:hypothetical protein
MVRSLVATRQSQPRLRAGWQISDNFFVENILE